MSDICQAWNVDAGDVSSCPCFDCAPYAEEFNVCYAWEVEFGKMQACFCEICLNNDLANLPFYEDQATFWDSDSDVSSDFGLSIDPRHRLGDQLDRYIVNNRPWTPTMTPLHLPCSYEDHEEELLRLTTKCIDAQFAILSLASHCKRGTNRTTKSCIKKVYKHQLLLVSIALYDACFIDYRGLHFDTCTCPQLRNACNALKTLYQICVVADVNIEPLWSYMDHAPRPCFNNTY